jgi:F-type H+-transporting ATPase subunit delta
MSVTKISKRYAKALFDFAQEQNTLEQITADMDYLNQLCSVSDDFVDMLKSPVIKASKKLEIMKAVFQGQVSEVSMRFLTIIAKSRREEIIPSLSIAFGDLYNESIGLKRVKLFSAQPLSADVREQIMTLLENQTNKKIDIHEEIQEDLLGGFILTMDDKQFDASIKSKLAKLRNELSKKY